MATSKKKGRAVKASKSKTPAVDHLCDSEIRHVLRQLMAGHPELTHEVEAVARSLLTDASHDAVADDVEWSVRGIDLDDVFGRAGRHEWGYVDPGEAACECVEEALQPIMADMKRRFELGFLDAAEEILKGLLVLLSHKRQFNAFGPITFELQISDFALAQIMLKLFHHPLQVAFHRFARIDFQDQVHAALEIKAKVYLLLGQKTGPPCWKLAP